jgi:hypothetical protein
MKLTPTTLLLQLLMLMLLCTTAFSNPSGFFLPDPLTEMTLKYRTIRNLIVLPVMLNDSIQVNLILDTGCRNLVLFGKRFRKLLKLNSEKQIQFSGLGTGQPVQGSLSLYNKVSIHEILGEKIPIIIVPEKNLFGAYHDVHGVIGYDIFVKFEIEINSKTQTITFRPAHRATPPENYTMVPLQIVDSRPIMNSNLFMDKKNVHATDLMIDTGSCLGLLLKTTDIGKFNQHTTERVIGYGLNGEIMGYETVCHKLNLNGFEINLLPTGIVQSPWHNNASIGMEVLKDYIIVLNYCKSYVCFKEHEG